MLSPAAHWPLPHSTSVPVSDAISSGHPPPACVPTAVGPLLVFDIVAWRRSCLQHRDGPGVHNSNFFGSVELDQLGPGQALGFMVGSLYYCLIEVPEWVALGNAPMHCGGNDLSLDGLADVRTIDNTSKRSS